MSDTLLLDGGKYFKQVENVFVDALAQMAQLWQQVPSGNYNAIGTPGWDNAAAQNAIYMQAHPYSATTQTLQQPYAAQLAAIYGVGAGTSAPVPQPVTQSPTPPQPTTPATAPAAPVSSAAPTTGPTAATGATTAGGNTAPTSPWSLGGGGESLYYTNPSGSTTGAPGLQTSQSKASSTAAAPVTPTGFQGYNAGQNNNWSLQGQQYNVNTGPVAQPVTQQGFQGYSNQPQASTPGATGSGPNPNANREFGNWGTGSSGMPYYGRASSPYQ